jgi:transcriptional regulator with XRE-family HTH domain
MDWAKTVRALRLRLRLKQGAMAELVGVSQTYISRLEAGITEPAPQVADAILRLSRDPRTRSTFDDFVATVRFSPFRCFIVQPEPEAGRYTLEAVSAGLRDGAAGEPAELADIPALAALKDQIDAVCAAGLEEGRLLSATAYWQDGNQPPGHWSTLYIPIRDEAGSCFLHATLTAHDADEYTRLVRQAGRNIVFELFNGM